MDAALREAVRVAGSMRALARTIGTSHQAIANWDRVPAERVPDVERATGVARHRLRPDLYPEPSGVGGTRTTSSRTIVDDLGEMAADHERRVSAKMAAETQAIFAAANTAWKQEVRSSVEKDPLRRAVQAQAAADTAAAAAAQELRSTEVGHPSEDPLNRVVRRTASRAIHSLLTLDPDILSNHNATLLERRIATFLYEELRQAATMRAHEEARLERARHAEAGRAQESEHQPSNLEAEQVLLGALLADNNVYERVEFLAPEHFADPIHGRIYKAISRRIEAGELADAVTLKAEFEHTGMLEEVGGTAYLARLLSASDGLITGERRVYLTAASERGRAIHNAWLRRQLTKLPGN
jgi:DNA-binding transcriptional regulator YdaS (Cro superfamily)